MPATVVHAGKHQAARADGRPGSRVGQVDVGALLEIRQPAGSVARIHSTFGDKWRRAYGVKVNYALLGDYIEDTNYEVIDECNGPATLRFIDELDVDMYTTMQQLQGMTEGASSEGD